MTYARATRIEWVLVGLLWAGPVSCAATPPATPPPPPTAPPAVAPARPLSARLLRVNDLKRQVEAAELRLAQAQIEVEHGDLRHRQTVGRLEKEFELAKRRLEIFTKMTMPARIARAELRLRHAEDECRVAEEDLVILEAAAAGTTTGDMPREVAVARARRRLEQTQRERDLQREELQVLHEVLLPLERMELELEGERKKHAVLEAHWDNERALLDRRLAVVYAEIELTRLEYDLIEAQVQAESAPTDNRAGGPRPGAPDSAGPS